MYNVDVLYSFIIYTKRRLWAFVRTTFYCVYSGCEVIFICGGCNSGAKTGLIPGFSCPKLLVTEKFKLDEMVRMPC